MARFQLNLPVVTRTPYVTVDAGLQSGKYRFRLVVVDHQGNRSRPDYVDVTVVSRRLSPGGGGVILRPPIR